MRSRSLLLATMRAANVAVVTSPWKSNRLKKGEPLRRIATSIAVAVVLAFPAAAYAGFDDASPCGQYHGLFGSPPGGGTAVANAASSGLFQGGVVGELNRNPACHG